MSAGKPPPAGTLITSHPANGRCIHSLRRPDRHWKQMVCGNQRFTLTDRADGACEAAGTARRCPRIRRDVKRLPDIVTVCGVDSRSPEHHFPFIYHERPGGPARPGFLEQPLWDEEAGYASCAGTALRWYGRYRRSSMKDFRGSGLLCRPTACGTRHEAVLWMHQAGPGGHALYFGVRSTPAMMTSF